MNESKYIDILNETVDTVLFDVQQDARRGTYNTQCFAGPGEMMQAMLDKQFLVDLHNDGQYYFYLEGLKTWIVEMRYIVEYFEYKPYEDIFLVIGKFDEAG